MPPNPTTTSHPPPTPVSNVKPQSKSPALNLRSQIYRTDVGIQNVYDAVCVVDCWSTNKPFGVNLNKKSSATRAEYETLKTSRI